MGPLLPDTKRRAGKAPEGTGASVGTEYNWLVVAHQRVDKLDSNSYMTKLEGKKFKVAHKRSGNERWSITEKTQRKKVIQFLEQVIQDLKEADEVDEVPFTVGNYQRIYGMNHRNMNELRDLASQREIEGRSKMNRKELIEAIKGVEYVEKNPDAVLDNGRDRDGSEFMDKKRDDFYNLAGKKVSKDVQA